MRYEASTTVAALVEEPVLKPNEAMFEEAFRHGSRAATIYTVPASVAGMEQEVRDEAARREPGARIRSIHAPGAREALAAGDNAGQNRIVAKAAAGIDDADVVLLARFPRAIDGSLITAIGSATPNPPRVPTTTITRRSQSNGVAFAYRTNCMLSAM